MFKLNVSSSKVTNMNEIREMLLGTLFEIMKGEKFCQKTTDKANFYITQIAYLSTIQGQDNSSQWGGRRGQRALTRPPGASVLPKSVSASRRYLARGLFFSKLRSLNKIPRRDLRAEG